MDLAEAEDIIKKNNLKFSDNAEYLKLSTADKATMDNNLVSGKIAQAEAELEDREAKILLENAIKVLNDANTASAPFLPIFGNEAYDFVKFVRGL